MRQNIVPRAFRRAGLLGALAFAGAALVFAPMAQAGGGRGGGGGGGSHGGGGGGGGSRGGGGGGGSRGGGGGGSHVSGGGHFSGGSRVGGMSPSSGGSRVGGMSHSGGGTSRGGSYSGYGAYNRGSYNRGSYGFLSARTAAGRSAEEAGSRTPRALTIPSSGVRVAQGGGQHGGARPGHGGGNYGHGGGYYGHGGGYYGHGGYGYHPGWGYHGYYSPYWGWGWNYWGWGGNWGWAPYWSTWWWGGPWGGTSAYISPGSVEVGVRPGRYAIVKTDVSPEEAQVYLDGKYVGSADDFDGVPDFLYLGPGTYHLEFRLPNYQTYATDLEVTRGQQVRVEEELKLEPGKSALDAFPPESKGTPLGRVFTKGADATAQAAPRGDDGWSDRETPPAYRDDDRGDDEGMDVRAMPPARASNRGRIKFRVTPEDAAVYMDDKYLGAADDLERELARRHRRARHALDHRHAPRLQEQDRGGHGARRLPGGRRRRAREVTPTPPREAAKERGPGKPGPSCFTRTGATRPSNGGPADAAQRRPPVIDCRGTLKEAPVLRRPTVLGFSLVPVLSLTLGLLLPAGHGSAAEGGAAPRKAFVSQTPVLAGDASSVKLDPFLRRLVADHANRAPLAWAVQSGTTEPLIRTETLAGGRLGAAVFVRTTDVAATEAAIGALGGYVRVAAGDILVAVVPVAALGALGAMAETISIESSQYRRALLDVSRSATKADLVQAGTGLSSPRTGAGVIVGVVDSGIDYTRPDFKNADGTTRIRSIWDISGVATGGSARTCSAAEINASTCPERDLNGHGTHVAGIAAGGGRLQAGFVGMAPGADIIAAKGTRSTTSTGGFADDDVVAAAGYIFQQAQAAGRPAVINMSLGGFGLSPLDGTSSYEQALSNLTGPGKIIVAAAGNSGSSGMHLSYLVSGSSFDDALETNWIPGTDGSQGVTVLWYGTGNISVGIAARENSTQSTGIPISPAVGPGQTTGDALVDLKDGSGTVVAQYLIDASTTSYSSNGAHAVAVVLKPVQSRYFSIYTFGTGTFDGWTNDPWSFSGRSDAFWMPGDWQKTVGTPGTATKVITVGAFSTKLQWTDVNGSQWSGASWCGSAFPNVLGDIACFSSRGPTRDGRTKPDIAAPGHRIASDLSTDSVANHTAQDRMQGGLLLMESGTSQASPHVAGIVALMLQANPTLTYTTALQALQNSATKDSFTGSATNNTWGAGKVNALEAVKAVGGGAGPSVCTEDAATMCLVGGRYRIQSHWKNQYAGGAVSTLSKAKLTDVTGAFWIANASTYEYLIRFNTATDNGRIWIAIPTFTDVEFWIDVTDTHTGQSFQYHSAAGNRTLLYDPTTFVYP